MFLAVGAPFWLKRPRAWADRPLVPIFSSPKFSVRELGVALGRVAREQATASRRPRTGTLAALDVRPPFFAKGWNYGCSLSCVSPLLCTSFRDAVEFRRTLPAVAIHLDRGLTTRFDKLPVVSYRLSRQSIPAKQQTERRLIEKGTLTGRSGRKAMGPSGIARLPEPPTR
jgi:hypothetical protein